MLFSSYQYSVITRTDPQGQRQDQVIKDKDKDKDQAHKDQDRNKDLSYNDLQGIYSITFTDRRCYSHSQPWIAKLQIMAIHTAGHVVAPPTE